MDSPIEKTAKKVNRVYEYSKDWTAHDFYGKYHLRRIKTSIPIPGTQVAVELLHHEKKAADQHRFNENKEANHIALQKTLHIKKQTTEVIILA